MTDPMTNTNNVTVNLVGYPTNVQQLPWLIRALWYLILGWPLAALWVSLAYLLALTIIGLPWAQRMFIATPTVLTLQRR